MDEEVQNALNDLDHFCSKLDQWGQSTAAGVIQRLHTENSVLWQTLEHIAAMDNEKYVLNNATALAKFAVEGRDSGRQ